MSQAPTRWGILACGHIAHAFAKGLQSANNGELHAVASRSHDKAVAFAQKYGATSAYGSYDDLINDPDVDIIYIASPHSHHYEHTMLCLNGGKHVLCEKAFAINADQAEKMFQLAAEKKRFLMEAMWTRCIPATQHFLDKLKSGIIGKPRTFAGEFSFNVTFDPKHRLFNPSLAGGALLDLGVYPISVCYFCFGYPDKITANAQLLETYVDATTEINLYYSNGLNARLRCSIIEDAPREVIIEGDKGSLRLDIPFFYSQSVSHKEVDGDWHSESIPFKGNGYTHEAEEAVNCIRKGKIQHDILSRKHSLDIMKIMDEVRKQIGLKYPGE